MWGSAAHPISRREGGCGARRVFRALLLPVALILIAAVPAVAFAQTEAPGFVYAKAIRGHIIVVNWMPPLSLTPVNYQIYRAQGFTLPEFDPAVEPGGSWSLVGTRVGRTNNSFLDDSVKATSTRYWYVVTAEAASVESSASPVNSPAQGWTDSSLQYQKYLPAADSYKWYIGPTTLPPLEPTNVRLSGADTTITVEWDAVPSSNVLRYLVYRAEQSGGEGYLIGEVNAPETTYVDAAENYGEGEEHKRPERYKHYWYRIVAQDTTGAKGLPSIEKHFRAVSSARPPSPHEGSAASRDAETCGVCHQLHDAGPNLLRTDEDTEVTLCLTCHDGTGSQFDVRREYTDAHQSSHAVTVTAGDDVIEATGTFTCVQCHSAHGGSQPSAKLLSVDGVTTGNGVCYGSGCHGAVEPANGIKFSEAFESSVHSTAVPGPESGTDTKCSTCHQPHASPNESLWTSSAYNACFQCHAGGAIDLGSPDIYTRITLSNDPDTSHDVLKEAQVTNGTYMACQHCHNTHSVTSTSPLVNPWSPGISGTEQWTESRTADLAVLDGTESHLEPRYNRFCFSCHGDPKDDKGGTVMPTGEYTMPWVAAPIDDNPSRKNIEADWDVRLHGRFSPTAGDPKLDVTMGYAKGQTLSCMVCHEPHGTINNYNLRSDVPAIDGTFPKQDLLLVQSLDSNGAPLAGQFDTRFFCSSCHEITTAYPPDHDQTGTANDKSFLWFPNNCTSSQCHSHETSSLGRF